jgi:RNA polymerase sigma-70 factor (ECF subfamily)
MRKTLGVVRRPGFPTPRTIDVALTAQDRNLLRRCLNHEPGAWNDFVDRFLGLIYHVIHHTAHLRSFSLQPEDTEDIAAEILLEIVGGDYAALRQFRGNSSLATYLTVIARRSCVHELTKRLSSQEVQGAGEEIEQAPNRARPAAPDSLEAFEEVRKLLKKLPARERMVVQLFFLEGRSYEEISTELNLPINSIGAILSRARKKLRSDIKNPPPRIDPKKFQGEAER